MNMNHRLFSSLLSLMATVSGLIATVWELRELGCKPVNLTVLTMRPCTLERY